MSLDEDQESGAELEPERAVSPTKVGGRRILLYTRSGCHLCEQAKQLLEKYRVQFGLAIVEIDIDQNPALKAAYDHSVPVVELDGKVRFRGHVNEVLLRRLLRAKPGIG